MTVSLQDTLKNSIEHPLFIAITDVPAHRQSILDWLPAVAFLLALVGFLVQSWHIQWGIRAQLKAQLATLLQFRLSLLGNRPSDVDIAALDAAVQQLTASALANALQHGAVSESFAQNLRRAAGTVSAPTDKDGPR